MEFHRLHQALLVNLSVVGTKPTGIANYVLNLVPHLQLPKVLLQSSNVPEADRPHDRVYPIPANMTPDEGRQGHWRRLQWTQWQVPQIYRDVRSTLLFSPVPEAPLATACRSVVVVHDLIPLRFPNWRSPLTLYARFYVPLVLQQAQHIICNSQSTAADVHQFYGVPMQKITPILLAHDASHFRVPSPQTPPEIPYFLYVGRHDPYKNLERLIQAFAGLPQVRDYHLYLAGSPDPRYTPLLRTQVAELELVKQVKFLDYVPYAELPKLINRAIALVFPSLWEGFGFPVLEAMACGTPVVTSNLSSLPEVAGDAAILVNPYETQAITAAMQDLITDEGWRSQLITAGLARAQQFSWDKTAAATTEVLQRFI